MNPKVSIIVPIYNMSKYLNQCLECLVNQTLKEIEIICIDDCSTDNSVDICNEYAQKDSRIRVIKQDTNQGQGPARNKGIETAKGEFLYFMDPDDEIELDLCETTYNAGIEHNADVILFDYDKNYMQTGESENFDPTAALRQKGFNIKPYEPYNFSEHPEYSFQGTKNFICIRLFNTSFIKKNNIKMGTTRRGQDKVFSIKAKMLANKMVYVNKTLFHYRIWREQQFIKNVNHFELINEMREVIYENCPKTSVIMDLNEYFIELTMRQYIGLDKAERKTLLDKSKYYLTFHSYKNLLKRIRKHNTQEIFSIKNSKINNKNYKIISLFGRKIKIKRKAKK